MESFLNPIWPFCWAGAQRTSHDGQRVDLENGIFIEGFLFKKASNSFKTWQRRWFMIQNNQLIYLKGSQNVPRVVMDDLRLCAVYNFSTIRRRYCFTVVSPTKIYMLQADSEGTRLAWTRAIKNIVLVGRPRSDDSEIGRYQGESALPGAPERTRDTSSIHRVEPPCNDDLERKSTDTFLIPKASDPHEGVLDVKSTDTYLIHRASSPNQDDLDRKSTGTFLIRKASDPHEGVLDVKSTDTYLIHRASSPNQDDLDRKSTDTFLIRKASDPHGGVLDVKSTDTYSIHRASSPNQGIPDKRRLSTDTYVLHRKSSPHEGVLDVKSTDTYSIHRASSPNQDLDSPSSRAHSVQEDSSPSNECFWTKYTIGKELGKGGYGMVWAGVRNTDGRQVAIKYVYKRPTMKYITIPGEAEPRPAEVALTHMVSRSPRCNYMIEFLEWFDQPLYYMLVLEMPSPCMDLHKYLKKGPLTEDVAQVIMAQVVVAACHCSDRGVLHRDIKTGNILVNPDTLEIKLIDFGCGDVLQTTPYREYNGTKINIPPELLTHGEYHGYPSTVWSLGILQYEVLCGDVPFKNEQQILNKDLNFTRDLSAGKSVVRDGRKDLSIATKAWQKQPISTKISWQMSEFLSDINLQSSYRTTSCKPGLKHQWSTTIMIPPMMIKDLIPPVKPSRSYSGA